MTAHCWSCPRRRRTAARYLWTCRCGSVVPLCVECCAAWRENAAADPGLLPESVTSIPAGGTA